MVRERLRHQGADPLDDAGSSSTGTGAVLVLTRPVLFARGALGRIRRAAAHPDRAVTRVLVPQEDPAAVALWSGAWLSRHGIDPPALLSAGLAFDRAHLPHDDPQARAWVRADDIGLVRAPEGEALRFWALREGARLHLQDMVGAVRAPLGRVRRRRSLARQRQLAQRRRPPNS